MSKPEADGGPRPRKLTRTRLLVFGAVGVVVLALIVVTQVLAFQLRTTMVKTFPDDVLNNPEMVRVAMSTGKPLFAKRCASCHGADMKGDQKKGAPNLTDSIWLYDFGHVADIEQTILYGIRSGLGKSRNITDMPGLGLSGQLYPAEVKDAVNYILYVSRKQPAAPESLKRGAAIFQDKGSCYDCHSNDAQGNADYGAPAFTDQDWLYGGDYDTVYKSVYYGRHGECPAWINKLSAAQIRSLAVFVYLQSHPPHSPTQSASVNGKAQSG